MKSYNIANLSVCLLTIALLGGCNTTTSDTAVAKTKPSPQDVRIAEYQGAYDAMPPVTQAELRQGRILPGNTPQMVYIALGKPDKITAGADGRRTIWTYRNFLPPKIKAQKEADALAKKKRHAAQRKAMASDPLMETAEAWRYGVLKHAVTDDEPDLAPKSANQSWSDYARYVQERRFTKDTYRGPPTAGGLTGTREGGTNLKILDDKAWDDYYEAELTSPLQAPRFVKLTIYFLDNTVDEALVDETASAFVPPPPPESNPAN